MSHLRDIMQRLASRQSPTTDHAPQVLFQDELERCTDAMLQYEWAWLERHREDLEQCRFNPTMLEASGGSTHLELLIAQASQYAIQLEELFRQRGLVPSRHSHTVAAAEHAWELSNPGLRAQWGIKAP
ncbi:hypothetical protein CPCC7001_1807 [Cyanobium sp. PCC 7001]|uniref:hypothetical protein n=1 Tax=Cyanobium sp. PCC 7001 TaxID=180281 RepID=UPI0001805296|nr:hypothetical protein [Cyanobium sp. PCC 7001]EDY38928.1 hypothetical protein CPCC7001_1807 [Cyanobium sp. PCC 7001]